MSGKATKPARKIDRRVQRTRGALLRAWVELIQEKPFDSITVQEVLDHAGVSRSTFYEHYRDKNDLLISGFDEGLQFMSMMLFHQNDCSDRVAPVREVFAHVAEMRGLHTALLASGRLQDFMDLAQGHFSRGIEQRLAALPRAKGIAVDQRPLIAHALAGSFLALMNWWLRRGTPGDAQQMDDLFHAMVWSGVAPSSAQPGPAGAR
jgi:AcrR family transcriptional regulator